MLEVVTNATFIYFHPRDDTAPMTRRQLIQVYTMAEYNDMYFKMDESSASFYVWVNQKVLRNSEINRLVRNLRRIFSNIELEVTVENIVDSNKTKMKLH